MNRNKLIKEYTVSKDYLGKVFSMADFHFDHKNIIKYCNRPFVSFDEMNEFMLREYHSVVGHEDTFIFLGDMTFGRDSKGAKYWLSRLAGKKIYLKGSHDEGVRSFSTGLDCLFVCDELIVHTPERDLLFIHEPERASEWDGWIVHGHHHNNSPTKFPFVNAKNMTINLSAEVINYKPISIRTILDTIKNNELRRKVL